VQGRHLHEEDIIVGDFQMEVFQKERNVVGLGFNIVKRFIILGDRRCLDPNRETKSLSMLVFVWMLTWRVTTTFRVSALNMDGVNAYVNQSLVSMLTSLAA
jgi:hypothetical protein